jgi:recombination protein RecA
VRIGINYNKGFCYKENLYSLEEVFCYIDNTITKIRQEFPNILTAIIWDSVSASPAKKELEDDYDPTTSVGLHARIMSKGLRKICGVIKKERIALVLTNQLRTKIGIVYGDSDVTTHGRALSFYASVRIKLNTKQKIENTKTKEIEGIHCVARIFKNKLAPSFRNCIFPIRYDYGIGDKESWLDYLQELQIVTGSTWKKIVVNEKEYSFQSSGWLKILKDKSELEEFVLKIIEEKMVIKYMPRDNLDLNIDSFLEVEQVQDDLKEKIKVFEEE